VAVPYGTGPRNRWYHGRNRHYYHDGPGFAPRRRGGGLASALGCMAVIGLLLVLLVIGMLW
jgi:hypothetical protein